MDTVKLEKLSCIKTAGLRMYIHFIDVLSPYLHQKVYIYGRSFIENYFEVM